MFAEEIKLQHFIYTNKILFELNNIKVALRRYKPYTGVNKGSCPRASAPTYLLELYRPVLVELRILAVVSMFVGV